MNILVLLIHQFGNLSNGFSLVISLWPIWGCGYIFHTVLRRKLLVVSANKLWTIVRD